MFGGNNNNNKGGSGGQQQSTQRRNTQGKKGGNQGGNKGGQQEGGGRQNNQKRYNDHPPASGENNNARNNNNGSGGRGGKKAGAAFDMKQEDEAIISTSMNSSSTQAASAQSNNAPKQGRSGNERALQKTNWLSQGSGASNLEELESTFRASGKNVDEPFNQFQGKKTSYRDEIYSTTIDMTKVSKEQHQRAMRIEEEVLGSTTSNRHMAEERNQVQVSGDGDEVGQEEAKYGATDRKNNKNVSNQDGGVFTKGANVKKVSNNKGKKNAAVKTTAPFGKFKTFHKTVDKQAFANMTEGFLAEFSQKTASPVADNQIFTLGPKGVSANLPYVQPSKPVVFTQQSGAPTFMPSQSQSQMMPSAPAAMNAANVQPFKMTSTTFTPGPQKNFTAPTAQADLSANTNPFAAKSAANPFAQSSSAPKEFKPSAKPFTPTTAPSTTIAPAFQPAIAQQQPQMPVSTQSGVPSNSVPSFAPNTTSATVFSPSPSFTPNLQSQGNITAGQGAPSMQPPQQQNQQFNTYQKSNGPGVNQGYNSGMPLPNGGTGYNQHYSGNQGAGNNMQYRQGGGYHGNQQHHYNSNNNNSRGGGGGNYYNRNSNYQGGHNSNYHNNHYNSNTGGGHQGYNNNNANYNSNNQGYVAQNQQQNNSRSYNNTGSINTNNATGGSSAPAMPMPMPMPNKSNANSTANNQAQSSQQKPVAAEKPAATPNANPFASLKASQSNFVPGKK